MPRPTLPARRVAYALAALIGVSAGEARARAAPEPELADRLTPPLTALMRPPPDLAWAGDAPRDRERALLITLARRYDDAHAFSASAAWRAVAGWATPGETLLTWDTEALDKSPARYPAARGRGSPADDFAASLARAWTEPDFACRFPIRARALYDAGLLAEIPAIERGGCPEFEAWARPDRVDGVELVFATASWVSPASSAGHIFFRVRPRGDGPVVAEHAELVVGHGVDLSAPGADDGFVLRGLTGDYEATLLTSSYYEKWLEYGAAEQRDLLVYELVLTERERLYLLAELWRQHAADLAIDYTFLSVNCARITWDTLRAVAPELPRRADWYLHPHEVVSALLTADRATPRGLVPSLHTLAFRGERRARAAAERLRAVPNLAGPVDALAARLSGPPTDRAAAYERFARDVDLEALGPAGAGEVTALADALVDLEAFASHRERSGAAASAGDDDDGVARDESAVSAALDAALAMRRRLPPRATARLEPFPPYDVVASASRRWTVTSAWEAGADAAALTLRYAVIDEQPGMQRAAPLRPSARTEFLASEIQLRLGGDGRPSVAWTRLTLVDIAGFGHGIVATDGWLQSRMGFGFAVATEAAPSGPGPVGGLVTRGAVYLTLAADDAFSRYLVVGLDLRVGAWLGGDEGFRVGAGAVVELGGPLARGPHRFVLQGRVTPSLDATGPALEAEASLGLAFVLDRRRVLTLGPTARWRSGAVVGDGAEVGLATGF